MAKKRKNIDLDEDVIKKLQLQAIEKGTVIKLYMEDMLTKIANRPSK